MKLLIALIVLPGVLLLCCIGLAAALLGFERMDYWCQNSLVSELENLRRLGTRAEWLADTAAILLVLVLVLVLALL